MSVFGFQSPEEMLLFVQRRVLEEQATENREPVTITVGDHWVRVVDFFPEIVVVFGKVTDQDLPGLCAGPTYSELDPEGREATTPASNILMTITEEEFEAAREAEWQLLPLMLAGHEFAGRLMQVAGLEP